VEEEKRTVIGVEAWLKCGAVVRVEAVVLGVKVPVRRWPFAWADCGLGCQLFVLGNKEGYAGGRERQMCRNTGIPG
jgi:hypothetical protein